MEHKFQLHLLLHLLLWLASTSSSFSAHFSPPTKPAAGRKSSHSSAGPRQRPLQRSPKCPVSRYKRETITWELAPTSQDKLRLSQDSHSGGVLNPHQVLTRQLEGDLGTSQFIKTADDQKEDVNKVSSDRVSPRSDQDVEENKADQKLSKENENQYYCPMEASESIASKQFKGVLASAIRQRLRELSEKARAATEAAHAIELLMLLGETNLGSDQMNEKVHEAAQLLKTSA